MIPYRVVIYSILVELRGRGKMYVCHFRHGMEGYFLYRNAISSLFARFYSKSDNFPIKINPQNGTQVEFKDPT